jgi:hypothetical protein
MQSRFDADSYFADGGEVEPAGGPANVSPAQREAGNFKKKHESVNGVQVAIENPKGSTRIRAHSGASKMAADYGQILNEHRNEDKDGMNTDTFVGPHKHSNKVFVVNQQHPRTGKFNEHKVLLGYKDRAHALRDYAHSFSDGLGHKRIQSVVEMHTSQLKDWLKKANHKKPLRKAEGGPVYDPMGNIAIGDDTDYRDVPGYGAVEAASEGIGKGAANYLGNVADAFRESSKYARQGLENTVSDKGPGYNVIGPAQYMLGSLGAVSAPMTGAFKSAGQAATELSGSPDIGNRLEAVLNVLPFGGGAAKGAAKTTAKAARTAEEEGIKYATQQDGPFYRVSQRALPEASDVFGQVRSEARQAEAADAAGAGGVRDSLPPLRPFGEIADVIGNPDTNKVLQHANAYLKESGMAPLERPDMPESSLRKQSAIGRTYQLAAEEPEAYKLAIFDAYKEQHPELVEESGAKNYDELRAASYAKMAKETSAQFDKLPIDFSFYKNGEGAYKNSRDMLSDLHGNDHLTVFQGGDPHDFLNQIDPETGLNENEKFRAVHDAFGHGVYANPFGSQGEEIAWGTHQQMYSPLAKPAMTSETRGQNSFVNYTPVNADLKEAVFQIENRIANAKQYGWKSSIPELEQKLAEQYARFNYAPNKGVLLPPEFMDPAYKGGMPDYVAKLIKPEGGMSSPMTHFSHASDLTELDPDRYGTGIAGDEAGRLNAPGAVKPRSYFYLGEPDKVTPELMLGENKAQLGSHAYTAQGEHLYDMTADPQGLVKLARASNRNSPLSNFNPGSVNQASMANDVERLAKEYGYSGVANPNAAFPMATVFERTPVKKVSRFAQGGPVGHYANGGPINLPEQVSNVAHDIARIAHKDRLDQRHLAYLLKVASGTFMPPERAMEFAGQIMTGDTASLMQRFQTYVPSARTFARLNEMLGGKHNFMGNGHMGKEMQRMKGVDALQQTKDALDAAMDSDVVRNHPAMAKALKKLSKRI